MADSKSTQERLSELEMGEEVSVIMSGEGQLVDVAEGILIPANTEVTLPLSNFVMNQLVLGNLLLSDDEAAPKAERSISDIEDLKYENRGQLANSRDGERGAARPRTTRRDGEPDDRGAEAARADQNSSTGNEALTSTTAKSTRSRRSADNAE